MHYLGLALLDPHADNALRKYATSLYHLKQTDAAVFGHNSIPGRSVDDNCQLGVRLFRAPTIPGKPGKTGIFIKVAPGLEKAGNSE